MLPYSPGLVLDNTNNYGIVKTETVFGFGPPAHNGYVNKSFNSTEPLEWIFTQRNFGSDLKADELRAFKGESKTITAKAEQLSKKDKKGKKKIKNREGKGKKCIYKVYNKSKRNRRRRKNSMRKKYLLPLILGVLAAKSLLYTAALKALAFLSAKGLMMGFFSTALASVLSLKGMFDHSHGYQNRKDDTKTQVEIIQVPSKSNEHIYYDEHYRRGDYDYVPVKYNINDV